jgi:lysophospholipase L1-like esterase
MAMRTGRAWTTVTLLLILTGLVAMATPAQAGERPKKVWYLALGDSLSVGVQPFASPTDNHPTDNGYADQLYQELKKTTPNLALKKLGCAVTETSADMLHGPSDCRSQYKLRVQLADAVAFLLTHRGSVKLVTIDIGANDIELCGSLETGIDPECVGDAFGSVGMNLPKILKALRLAAGPHVPIVGMNYYNPFLAAWLAPDHQGEGLAVQSNQIVGAYNGLLASIYQLFHMPIADVATAFDTTNFDDQAANPLPYGPDEIPQNVYNVCVLTYMCTHGNIHATTDGYGIITQAFLEALP